MSADAQAAGLPAPQADAAGVIHNIGYRRYEALRLGRAQIVRALTWYSLRSAFGIGRGAKAKIFPVVLFALICLPAAVNAVALATDPSGGPIVDYDDYVPQLRIIATLIFVAIEAPNLVSSDLRTHSLPLYFARPISRADYAIAKLAAFVLACLALIEIPLLLLYVGNAAQVHGPSAVWAQTTGLGPGLLFGAAWALLLAPVALLLASTTGKRVFAICAVGIPLFFTFVLAHVLMQIGGQAFGPVGVGQPSALASLSGLISPFTLLGGVLHWLRAAPVPGGPIHGALMTTTIGHFGLVYGVMYVVVLAAAILGLLWRYKKVAIA
jgi:ABC-2 type transport system permease protein